MGSYHGDLAFYDQASLFVFGGVDSQQVSHAGANTRMLSRYIFSCKVLISHGLVAVIAPSDYETDSSSINKLPTEIILLIFSWLPDGRTALDAGVVCRRYSFNSTVENAVPKHPF